MFKKRSIALFITSILTTLDFIIMLLVTLLMSAEDLAIAYDLTPGSEEFDFFVSSIQVTFVLTVVVFAIAMVLYWIGFASKLSGFILAGAIILTIFGILNFILFPPVIILGYVSFSMQRKINQREKMASDMPGNNSSSSIDPAIMQF